MYDFEVLIKSLPIYFIDYSNLPDPQDILLNQPYLQQHEFK